MIKYVTKSFLVLSLLIVGGLTAVRAQLDSNTILDANIPFQFTVGNTTLPAGKYVIKPLDNSGDNPNVIEVRSTDDRMAVIFDSENASLDNAPKKSEIIFDKIGNQYFLSQIFVEGENYGAQMLESRMEKKLKSGGQMASKQSVECRKRKTSEAKK